MILYVSPSFRRRRRRCTSHYRLSLSAHPSSLFGAKPSDRLCCASAPPLRPQTHKEWPEITIEKPQIWTQESSGKIDFQVSNLCRTTDFLKDAVPKVRIKSRESQIASQHPLLPSQLARSVSSHYYPRFMGDRKLMLAVNRA